MLHLFEECGESATLQTVRIIDVAMYYLRFRIPLMSSFSQFTTIRLLLIICLIGISNLTEIRITLKFHIHFNLFISNYSIVNE